MKYTYNMYLSNVQVTPSYDIYVLPLIQKHQPTMIWLVLKLQLEDELTQHVWWNNLQKNRKLILQELADSNL